MIRELDKLGARVPLQESAYAGNGLIAHARRQRPEGQTGNHRDPRRRICHFPRKGRAQVQRIEHIACRGLPNVEPREPQAQLASQVLLKLYSDKRGSWQHFNQCTRHRSGAGPQLNDVPGWTDGPGHGQRQISRGRNDRTRVQRAPEHLENKTGHHRYRAGPLTRRRR